MSLFLKEAVAEHPNGKNLTREEILALWPPKDYGPGRTKQAFKDDADINKILARAQKAGSLSHFERHGAMYGDFSDLPTDPFEARAALERGKAIFGELPSEIRRDFQNDPLRFFEFVNDPANKDRLPELLPAIAKRGRYFPDVSPSTPPGAPLGAPSEPQANVPRSPQAPIASGDSQPPAASQEG